MPIIALPQGEVSYTSEGQGAPIIMLHANPGDSRDFSGIVPALSSRYQVIRLDWPGYGRSPAPACPQDASAMYFYEVLAAFVAALNLPAALLVGNSVGGYAAARLAMECPQRVAGLVLVSPGGFTRQNLLTRAFCALQASAFAIPPVLFARLYIRRRSDVAKQALVRAADEQSTTIARQVNRAVWKSFSDPAHDLSLAAASITQPTLLVFGKYDPVIPANADGKRALRCIPGAHLHVLDTGHLVFAENPQAFLDCVMPFIAQVFKHDATG